MPDNIRHYAVFWMEGAKAMWCRARTKRAAVRQAKHAGGYAVQVNYGSSMAWDAPTFKLSGDVIADFTKERP